jgi:hypothetical protein
MSLLQEIVDTFVDSSARPSERIALYHKFLELRQKHRVRLAGRLLVIDGGREKHLSPMRHKSYPHNIIPEPGLDRRLSARLSAR